MMTVNLESNLRMITQIYLKLNSKNYKYLEEVILYIYCLNLSLIYY